MLKCIAGITVTKITEYAFLTPISKNSFQEAFFFKYFAYTV